jgi:hypothetical protein
MTLEFITNTFSRTYEKSNQLIQKNKWLIPSATAYFLANAADYYTTSELVDIFGTEKEGNVVARYIMDNYKMSGYATFKTLATILPLTVAVFVQQEDNKQRNTVRALVGCSIFIGAAASLNLLGLIYYK